MSRVLDVRVRRSGAGLVQVVGSDATSSQILTLLSQEPGDMLHDPEQGLALRDLLLVSPIVARGVAEQRIRDQFARYLPTVRLEALVFQTSDETLSVEVEYVDVQTGASGGLLIAR